MTKTLQFKSKKDCREFKIKVPESSEDIENNDFIEINGKTRITDKQNIHSGSQIFKRRMTLKTDTIITAVIGQAHQKVPSLRS